MVLKTSGQTPSFLWEGWLWLFYKLLYISVLQKRWFPTYLPAPKEGVGTCATVGT
jgi:hypothetical protein